LVVSVGNSYVFTYQVLLTKYYLEDFKGGKLPGIPCIPMSSVDAIQLLSKLNGHGPSAKEFGDLWQEGGLGYYGVHYNVGPSPPGLSLHIHSHADIRETQIHNVIGTIPGRITDEVVIVGNHRDAWGPGAGDPGSGSAALNEVVRSFGVALQQGWRPERTIVFASFEGEEFLQIGSLLWVTQHLDWIRTSAVAYLNVVVAASGSHFHAKASPLLHSTVLDVTGLILSPNQTSAGQTVRDVWGGHITPAGSGDANRFIHLSCVSTLDFGFTPALGEPVFPYHTGFDNFEWMDQVGDPGWEYHVTSAKMWSLMTAHLVEPGVLNMNVTDYPLAFQEWLEELKDRDLWSPKVDLTVMIDAIQRLFRAANRFESFADSLRESQCPRWKFWATCRRNSAISGVNKVYVAFERQFYYEGGINGHDDWHHVVFTPSAWHNTPLPMPGLWKSLLLRDWENARVRHPLINVYKNSGANYCRNGEIYSHRK
jgi:N-acetylated-alpha-linked acidic dipeptidase